MKAAREDVHTPWTVYVSAAVDGAHVVKDDPAKLRFGMDVDDEEGDTWFTLNPTFEHDGEGLSEDEMRKLVREGKKWMRKNKTWVKVDAAALKEFELNAETSGLRRWRGRRKQYYYRFKPAQRDRITDIFSLSGTVEHAQRYQAFLAQLQGFNKIERLPLPKDMALPLRPYQQQGFEWISFLAGYGLNGILADDMGLGRRPRRPSRRLRI